MKTRSLSFTLLTACLTSTPAAAWDTSVAFKATVHAHAFDGLEVSNQGCTLVAKLRFTAPPEAYRADAAVRNHYRFKARLEFRDGRTITSRTFYSPSPARRFYVIRHDSSREGCWADQRQYPSKVDVEGCRGADCRVEPFKG